MGAVKFIKEKERMCASLEECSIGCTGCRFYGKDNYPCSLYISNHPEEAVQVVEAWSKEHPIKTNGMKFREVFGFYFPVHYMLTSEAEAYRGWLNEEYKEE